MSSIASQGGSELQGALMELYGTFIENAVQFGCSNARMRKVSELLFICSELPQMISIALNMFSVSNVLLAL
jgi:hypothetical protein